MRNNFGRLAIVLFAALALAALLSAAAAKPKSVVHVITVNWKPGTTPDQIKAALDGAANMKYPGLKNVWLRPIKIQGGFNHVIVMEFESEESLKNYSDSAPQKEWYKVYLPIRGESVTHDITN